MIDAPWRFRRILRPPQHWDLDGEAVAGGPGQATAEDAGGVGGGVGGDGGGEEEGAGVGGGVDGEGTRDAPRRARRWPSPLLEADEVPGPNPKFAEERQAVIDDEIAKARDLVTALTDQWGVTGARVTVARWGIENTETFLAFMNDARDHGDVTGPIRNPGGFFVSFGNMVIKHGFKQAAALFGITTGPKNAAGQAGGQNGKGNSNGK
ncbi:MAG: hypothetical protein NUW22_13735 [Acidobacteria bacterium]|nr:hypothetical protein [Acidobacteriota bacterium]